MSPAAFVGPNESWATSVVANASSAVFLGANESSAVPVGSNESWATSVVANASSVCSVGGQVSSSFWGCYRFCEVFVKTFNFSRSVHFCGLAFRHEPDGEGFAIIAFNGNVHKEIHVYTASQTLILNSPKVQNGSDYQRISTFLLFSSLLFIVFVFIWHSFLSSAKK